MGGATDRLDLAGLLLASGEGRRLQLHVHVDGARLAGQRYGIAGGRVPARLDVSRTMTGWSLRLRYEATLEGPCMRCLEPAGRTLEIDAREIDQPGGGEDLSSPYVEGGELDLRAWAGDALTLDLAGQVLCRRDCAGLCGVCGQNLTEHPHAHEPAIDPRWSKLSELGLP